ncbi:hypothetical protein ACHAWF_003224, partial [Thalassiosira exigua]
MKIATILIAAAVAVPQAAAQLQLRDMKDGPAALKGAESRGLFSQRTVDGANTVVFEECLGRPAPACRGMIAKAVQGSPQLFGGRTSLNFLTIHVRTATDSEYNKVFLRMDQTETVVEGVLGDSMVFYPHPWCPPGMWNHLACYFHHIQLLTCDGFWIFALSLLSEGECYQIGPWDCAIGDPLSFNDCCVIVTQGVPTD